MMAVRQNDRPGPAVPLDEGRVPLGERRWIDEQRLARLAHVQAIEIELLLRAEPRPLPDPRHDLAHRRAPSGVEYRPSIAHRRIHLPTDAGGDTHADQGG